MEGRGRRDQQLTDLTKIKKHMNASTIGGIVRALLAGLAGYLGGKGIDITGLLSPEVTTAAGVVIASIWSIWAKKPKAEKPLDN
jgi:membrane protein DedA with SNARE-associated domain